MKIANPWPYQPHIRFKCKPGDTVGTCGACPEIDVPDGTKEAFIEPITKGRSDAQPLCEGKMWSEKWGVLDVTDHLTKMEVEKGRIEMEALKAAEAKRREEEGRQRKEAEKAAKVKEAKEAKEAKAEPPVKAHPNK